MIICIGFLPNIVNFLPKLQSVQHAHVCSGNSDQIMVYFNSATTLPPVVLISNFFYLGNR